MASLGLISHPVSSRDVAIFRPSEIEEGELTNCRFLSRTDSIVVVGAAGDGLTRSSYARPSDREPGEVCRDSGSDGVGSRCRIRKLDIGISDDGNKRSTLDNEKGKSSSVVWIRDCAKADRHVRGMISQTIDARTPITVPLTGKTDVVAAAFSYVSTAPDSSRSVSPLSSVEDGPAETCIGNSHGAAVLDDYVSIPSITACRWANDAESPVEEDKYFYDEMPKLKRKMPAFSGVEVLQRLKRKRHVPGNSETTWQRKFMTDDFEKFREEGSEGETVSSSDERTRSSNSYTDQDETDIDLTWNHNQIGPISSILETDSDDNCSPHGSPSRNVNMLQGCRNVNEFERLSKINEGTYGVVYKAKDNKTGEIVALKKVKMEKETEGFPLTALREINILLAFHHPSLVGVKEVVVGSDLDSIFMSMEYMEHDLRELMMTMKHSFSQSEVKCLMVQLLGGVKYLHDNWVLHRDLKSSNLLLNNRGELKICDFGLARQYGSPLKPYTALVVTLWYRAPELLLGAKEYSTAIDMWSVGCIMAELLSKKPLFDGKKEVDQLDKIFKLLGTPNENIWPGVSKLPGAKANFVNHRYNRLRQKYPATSFTGSPVLSDAGFCLLNSLLSLDPKQRITAEDALKHEWFQEVPLPREKEFMPTYPSRLT